MGRETEALLAPIWKQASAVAERACVLDLASPDKSANVVSSLPHPSSILSRAGL